MSELTIEVGMKVYLAEDNIMTGDWHTVYHVDETSVYVLIHVGKPIPKTDVKITNKKSDGIFIITQLVYQNILYTVCISKPDMLISSAVKIININNHKLLNVESDKPLIEELQKIALLMFNLGIT
ncbi:MAG: hypothetical protein CMC55_08555 [Flavobacteriaceae bacterium]|nr:hypothetical protein [Flavobacteriaceae bacterium]|tara:strand:+ start:2659 stop:3033 length:375 start_codon:yes stop_codon:yes gene_type:complete